MNLFYLFLGQFILQLTFLKTAILQLIKQKLTEKIMRQSIKKRKESEVFKGIENL